MNVIILRRMYYERPANEGQFGLATGSRELTGSWGSPLRQRGPATEEHASVSDGFTPLIELRSKQRRGETSPTVGSKRQAEAVLRSTASLCLPCSQKRGLEQARVAHPRLLKLARARRSRLAVAEGETEMKEQERMG